MLIGVFKSNQKIVVGLIVLLTALLWIPSFITDAGTKEGSLISTSFLWLDVIIAIGFIIGQAIYLNIIVTEFKLLKDSSFLSSLMFILLSSCGLLFLNLSQVIIANSFILIALHQLLRMYNLKNNYATLFNAGFLIGLASLLYLPSVTFFALVWFTLIYTTTPKWRDFIISIIGLGIPLTYFFVYKLMMGEFDTINFNDYLVSIFVIEKSQLGIFNQLLFTILAIITSLSFIALLASLTRSVVRVKKMLVIVLWMLLIGLGSLALNEFDFMATFILITIPLSIILANFFQNFKKAWLAELIFLIFLVGILLSYFS